MIKVIKLVHSPFAPPFEVAGDLVIKMHVPYSQNSVTIQVNPSLEHYDEKKQVEHAEIRQATLTGQTDETKVLSFDLEKKGTTGKLPGSRVQP